MSYVSTELQEVIRIDRIITIHYFEYMNNFTFSGEQHDFWELLYVDKGEVHVQADTNNFILRKGDVIFHKPMEFHAMKSVGNSAPNLIAVSFISESPVIKHFEHRIFTLSKAGSIILSRLITEARQAFSTPLHIPSVEKVEIAVNAPFGAEQLVRLYLEELLINFLRESIGCLHPMDSPVAGAVPAFTHDPIVQKILFYLEEHICEKLHVSQICNDNLIGRSQLQELFHKEFKCGVIEHFSHMKIEHAKELIRTSSMNFSELSEYLSFRTPSYFSKKFRQVVGMSPSEYITSIKGLLSQVKEINSRRSKKRS